MGLKPDHVAWVPSNGAAPAMQDLAAGGIDIVTCSVPEARAMIDAGKAEALAIMANGAQPAVRERADPERDARASTTRSVPGAASPAPRACRPTIADDADRAELKKAYDSQEFQDFMNARGFGMTFADQAGFTKFMADGDKAMGDRHGGRRPGQEGFLSLPSDWTGGRQARPPASQHRAAGTVPASSRASCKLGPSCVSTMPSSARCSFSSPER